MKLVDPQFEMSAAAIGGFLSVDRDAEYFRVAQKLAEPLRTEFHSGADGSAPITFPCRQIGV